MIGNVLDNLNNAKNLKAEQTFDQQMDAITAEAQEQSTLYGDIEKAGGTVLGLTVGAKTLYDGYKKIKDKINKMKKGKKSDDDDEDEGDEIEDNEGDSDFMDALKNDDFDTMRESIAKNKEPDFELDDDFDDEDGLQMTTFKSNQPDLSEPEDNTYFQPSDDLGEIETEVQPEESNFFSSFFDNPTDLLSGLKSSASDALDSVTSQGMDAISNVQSSASNALDSVTSQGTNALDSITSQGSNALDSITSQGSSALDDLTNTVSGAADTAGDVAGDIAATAADTAAETGLETAGAIAEAAGPETLGIGDVLGLILQGVGLAIGASTTIAGVVGSDNAENKQETDESAATTSEKQAMALPANVAGKFAMGVQSQAQKINQ